MEPEHPDIILDDSDLSWQDITSKLEFISKVKVGEKIDVQSQCVMSCGYWTSFYRSYLSSVEESRWGCLKFIKQVIAKAFVICAEYASSDNRLYHVLGKKLGFSIQRAKIGLLNICKTYAADSMFVSKVNALISVNDAKIIELAKTYPEVIEVAR